MSSVDWRSIIAVKIDSNRVSPWKEAERQNESVLFDTLVLSNLTEMQLSVSFRFEEPYFMNYALHREAWGCRNIWFEPNAEVTLPICQERPADGGGLCRVRIEIYEKFIVDIFNIRALQAGNCWDVVYFLSEPETIGSLFDLEYQDFRRRMVEDSSRWI